MAISEFSRLCVSTTETVFCNPFMTPIVSGCLIKPGHLLRCWDMLHLFCSLEKVETALLEKDQTHGKRSSLETTTSTLASVVPVGNHYGKYDAHNGSFNQY